MSLANKLALLETKGAFPSPGVVTKRWGELIREIPPIFQTIARLSAAGSLAQLHTLGRLHSGVVTRANAFFLVRELPFDQIPRRFGVTRQDFARVAVVMDGLETPHRIERLFLRSVIKGPEALISPREIEETDLRLFDVTADPQELRRIHAAGAAAYIRRGETVTYNVSEDTLKGGIPAERAQVRNRKPHWYSLHVPNVESARIVLPEHIDRRYICSLVPASDHSAVIDTLYTFSPQLDESAEVIWASLNTLLTWIQIETRGRTQHGERVLKVKIPDYGGLWLLNPTQFSRQEHSRLLAAFRQISAMPLSNSLEAASEPHRVAFDEEYLRLLGWSNPSESRLMLERELRAASGERQERKASVSEAKIDRRRTIDVAASVEAYASRLAAAIDVFPDPRRFFVVGSKSVQVAITGAVNGRLIVGTELFNQGEVLSGSTCIARAPNVLSAQYVRSVLLHDPELQTVDVPREPTLGTVIEQWKRAAMEWQGQFDRLSEEQLKSIIDPKLRVSIRTRALSLLRAE